MNATCKACGVEFGVTENRRSYCTDVCSREGKRLNNAASAEKRKIAKMKEGKICKQCHTKVHEFGMRAYCYDCREKQKHIHDNRKKRTPRPEKDKPIDTKTLTPEQVMKQINKKNKKTFNPRPPKKHKPINPKWLERNYK